MQKVGGQIITFTSLDNSFSLFHFHFFTFIFHFHFFFTFEGGMQKVGGQIIAFTSLDNSLSALRSVPSPLTEPKAIIFCIYFKGTVSQFCLSASIHPIQPTYRFGCFKLFYGNLYQLRQTKMDHPKLSETNE